MTAEWAVALVGGGGFITSLIAFLTWLNTRGSTKSKGSADAMTAWQSFMGRASEDREREHDRVLKRRDELYIIRGMLIDLVQELIELVRSKGVGPGRIESYQDKLDDIRRR
ncbi:hypothetical protein H7K45_27730 [Mycobacterium yunnanensis]|uniref:Uncharacterized protein n=1 Tax=Mycobacterium yunnanensis TaxID=368477 RepID=A0A9X3C3G2_9MYCO|nr:hypothetical protein [Mycobacterium yunnanensis]MCV7424343.1 hypothetical protein [Mycobacterium yunnanensis]